jgi:hypothetical protein
MAQGNSNRSKGNTRSSNGRGNRTRNASNRNTRSRKNSKSSDGRPASQKPETYRFAHNVGGEGTVPEREYLEYSKDGAGVDEPDLILNVPVLKLDGIHLQVEDVEAHVALQAQVLDLLKLNVGIDVTLGKVRVDVKGVEAQALLKVRLDHVAASIDRVLTAIDRNPELLESVGAALEDVGWGAGHMLAESGEAVEHVGGGTGEALQNVGPGAAQAVGDIGAGAGEAVGDVGEGTGEAVDEIGAGAARGVGEVGRGAGQAVGDIGEGAGEAVDPAVIAKETVRPTARQIGATATEGAKQTTRALGAKVRQTKERRRERLADEHNATKAALGLAEELDVDLAEVKGSGAEGRVTVNDVRSAARDNGA